VDALDALQRQVEGSIRKVQSGGKLGELRESFCEELSGLLLEARDVILIERRDLGLEPSGSPKEPVVRMVEPT
jgi:hypothetical protein